jgi:hypothetical protein
MMKLQLLTSIAASLVCYSSARADEEPSWEIRLHMAGGGDVSSQRPIGEFLNEHFKGFAAIGNKASLRVAGFDNPETPGDDWVAELEEVANLEETLEGLTRDTKPDAGGKFTIKDEGLDFSVWKYGPAALRFAGPAQNSKLTVKSMVQVNGNTWIAGWVNLARLPKDAIQSKLLKLPETLSFELSSQGDQVKLELHADLVDPTFKEFAQRTLEELGKELASKSSAKQPVFELKTDDKALTATIQFDHAQIGMLLGELSKDLDQE